MDSNVKFGCKPTVGDIKLGQRRQLQILASLPLPGNRTAIDALKARTPRRIQPVNVERRLLGLKEHAKVAASADNARVVGDWVDRTVEDLHTDEKTKDRAELIAAARGGCPQAQAALSVAISETGGYMIRATSNWGQAYETVTLAADEMPYLRGRVPMEVDVKVGTPDGGLEVRHAMQDVDHRRVDLFFMLTEKFAVTLFDPYHGDIRDAQLATVDLAFDLGSKIDSLLQIPLMVGTTTSILTAAFTLDGSPGAHYHAHSRIFTGNLPTGNLITLADNSGTTKPGLRILRAILEYETRWGSGAFVQGDLQAQAIHISSALASQFADEFTLTSTANPYTDGLFKSPFSLNFGGRNYLIVPDNTIDPADKHVYVRFNHPVGLFFEKPAGGKVFSNVHEEENEEITWQRSLIGTAIPNDRVPFWVAIKFKN